MPGVCSHCGSTDIDIDQTRGDSVCTGCGSVLEDQRIVSEVQFQELGSGAAGVVGQFVGDDGGKEPSLGSGFQHGYGKESKAETLLKAKRRIQTLGAALKLNQHCIDTAANFFKMAYLKRLTRTRRSSHVIAACVYLVCRTEGLPHMLLDVSDAVQVNVYTLGKTYLILSRHLCINIPAIDPCLYIPRFAHRLEFGDKTHEVSMTALRLVQRMKRDWMSTGRRPSGLCGSALLVAARLHEFSRSVKDIVKVVKVCQSTIKKRLNEFVATASSNLTIDEFQRIDLETEHDPPAYIEGKKKTKHHQALESLDDANTMSEYASEVDDYQEQIEKSLSSTSKYLIPTTSEIIKEIKSPTKAQPKSSESSSTSNQTNSTENPPLLNGHDHTNNENNEKNNVNDIDKIENETISSILGNIGPRPTAASLGIEDSVKLCMYGDMTGEREDGELDLTGIDDDELDKFLLTPEETRAKTTIWMAENGEFLRLKQEKADKEAKEAEENPKKAKKKPRKPKVPIQAKTASDAIEQMLQQKRISNKINYEVLKDLNKDMTPSFVCDVAATSSTGDASFSRFRKPSTQSMLLSPKAKADTRSLKRPNTARPDSLSMKRVKTEASLPIVQQTAAPTVMVESGPVAYDAEDGDNDEDYEEDEEEEQLTAAIQMFGNAQYEEEDYDNDIMDGMD